MGEQNKRTTVMQFIVFFAIIAILALAYFLTTRTSYSLEWTDNNETIVLEYGVDTELPEMTAICKGNMLHRRGIEVTATVQGEVDLSHLGSYQVTYIASFQGETVIGERTVHVVDTLPPEITLVSNPEHFTSPVARYEEEGYSAIDLHDGDVTASVISEERDGFVYYTVTDSSGNTATAQREIIYKDVVAPVITLEGGTSYQAQLGQDFADPGYTAVDDCDGDISANVTVEGTVDGHKEGTYTLTYKVEDSSGNICEIERKVSVKDLTGPVITLSGEKDLYIKVGSSYSEPGYSAIDNLDGDVTAKVQVSGSVDTSKMGSNTITYTATDANGNTTTETRYVFVYEKQAVAAVANPGDKIIYLTFDDGPGKYTARLLDVLDKYGVKATFFVTNQFPSYQNMIGESYRRGHTIALHTYSHKFNEVYASESAYYTDLEKIQSVVQNQTGTSATIVRFPGGTSNTVSKKYCSGLMTTLSKNISYHGYFYCDWNVDSKDAGGAKTAEAVANNVIAGVQKYNVSIVLQHDIHSYSVDAVEKIIFWGLENGYTFLPMEESTPMVHFSANN